MNILRIIILFFFIPFQLTAQEPEGPPSAPGPRSIKGLLREVGTQTEPLPGFFEPPPVILRAPGRPRAVRFAQPSLAPISVANSADRKVESSPEKKERDDDSKRAPRLPKPKKLHPSPTQKEAWQKKEPELHRSRCSNRILCCGIGLCIFSMFCPIIILSAIKFSANQETPHVSCHKINTVQCYSPICPPTPMDVGTVCTSQEYPIFLSSLRSNVSGCPGANYRISESYASDCNNRTTEQRCDAQKAEDIRSQLNITCGLRNRTTSTQMPSKMQRLSKKDR